MLNLKRLLGLGLLAGTLLKADTNFYLHCSDNTVTANPTTQERKYTLFNSTNLLENSWNEVETKRGTNSNLEFTVNNVAPANFYKADGVYSPIEPISTDVQYSHYPHQDTPTCVSIGINNYTTNSINVNVIYTEVMNPFGFSYTATNQWAQTLLPGNNSINHCLYWAGLPGHTSGTGGTVFGNLSIQIIPQLKPIKKSLRSKK